MRHLSRDEMKKVMGGDAPVAPGCGDDNVVCTACTLDSQCPHPGDVCRASVSCFASPKVCARPYVC